MPAWISTPLEKPAPWPVRNFARKVLEVFVPPLTTKPEAFTAALIVTATTALDGVNMCAAVHVGAGEGDAVDVEVVSLKIHGRLHAQAAREARAAEGCDEGTRTAALAR